MSNITTLDNQWLPNVHIENPSTGEDQGAGKKETTETLIISEYPRKLLEAFPYSIFEPDYFFNLQFRDEWKVKGLHTEIINKRVKINWEQPDYDFSHYIIKISKNNKEPVTYERRSDYVTFITPFNVQGGEKYDIFIYIIDNEGGIQSNKYNALSITVYKEVKEIYIDRETYKVAVEVAPSINGVINSVKNEYFLPRVDYSISKLGLKIQWDHPNIDKNKLLYYKIVYNVKGSDPEWKKVINVSKETNVYYLNGLDFKYEYMFAVVPIVKHIGEIFTSSNIHEVYFEQFNFSSQDEKIHNIEIQTHFKERIPEYIREEENIVTQTVRLMSNKIKEMEMSGFSSFEVDDVKKEFKLNEECVENNFYNILHPELLKSLFSFKGTFADIEYFLKRLARYDVKIFELVDEETAPESRRCDMIWLIDNIKPEIIHNRHPLEVYPVGYDDISCLYINNKLPWSVDNGGTDIVIAPHDDCDDQQCPREKDCKIATEVTIDLDSRDFLGYFPDTFTDSLKQIIDTRLYICIQLEYILVKLKTRDRYETDILDEHIWTIRKHIKDYFDFLAEDRTSQSIELTFRDRMYDCPLKCITIEPHLIHNIEPWTIFEYNDILIIPEGGGTICESQVIEILPLLIHNSNPWDISYINGFYILPNTGYKFENIPIGNYFREGPECGFWIDNKFPIEIYNNTNEIVMNDLKSCEFMPCGPLDNRYWYTYSWNERDEYNFDVVDKFSVIDCNYVHNVAPWQINENSSIYIRDCNDSNYSLHSWHIQPNTFIDGCLEIRNNNPWKIDGTEEISNICVNKDYTYYTQELPVQKDILNIQINNIDPEFNISANSDIMICNIDGINESTIYYIEKDNKTTIRDLSQRYILNEQVKGDLYEYA